LTEPEGRHNLLYVNLVHLSELHSTRVPGPHVHLLNAEEKAPSHLFKSVAQPPETWRLRGSRGAAAAPKEGFA